MLSFSSRACRTVKPQYRKVAGKANELGLGINTGHDLDLENLRYLKEQIPYLNPDYAFALKKVTKHLDKSTNSSRIKIYVVCIDGGEH